MTSWESIAIGSRKEPLPTNFDIAEVSMCRGSRHAGENRCRRLGKGQVAATSQ